MAETEETCCFFIPIKLGCQILALWMLIGGAYYIYMGVMSLAVLALGIIQLVLCLPMLLVAFYSFKWLSNDNADTRKLFTFAVLICMIVTVFQLIMVFVKFIALSVPFGSLLQFIITTGLNVLLMFYFYTVAKRYQAISGDSPA